MNVAEKKINSLSVKTNEPEKRPSIARKPEEYAGVMRLANCYIATHVKERIKSFISKNPETDIKTAQTAAQAFAKSNEIHYHENLLEADRPILTVLKNDGVWFPAELLPDNIRLITHLGPIDLGGTQQQARNMANVIALSKDCDFIPQIGISLEK